MRFACTVSVEDAGSQLRIICSWTPHPPHPSSKLPGAREMDCMSTPCTPIHQQPTTMSNYTPQVAPWCCSRLRFNNHPGRPQIGLTIAPVPEPKLSLVQGPWSDRFAQVCADFRLRTFTFDLRQYSGIAADLHMELCAWPRRLRYNPRACGSDVSLASCVALSALLTATSLAPFLLLCACGVGGGPSPSVQPSGLPFTPEAWAPEVRSLVMKDVGDSPTKSAQPGLGLSKSARVLPVSSSGARGGEGPLSGRAPLLGNARSASGGRSRTHTQERIQEHIRRSKYHSMVCPCAPAQCGGAGMIVVPVHPELLVREMVCARKQEAGPSQTPFTPHLSASTHNTHTTLLSARFTAERPPSSPAVNHQPPAATNCLQLTTNRPTPVQKRQQNMYHA